MNWDNQQLKALDHCCEEASTASHGFYVPCNKPAVNIVGWKGRSDTPIRMCDFCTHHNVNNRGGYVVGPYTSHDAALCAASWPTQKPADPWPKETMEFDKAMASLNPWDNMNEDQLLLLWQQKKDAIEKAKADEMDLRKYIVKREFPKPHEGMNTKELGQGYELKAAIKYNYNLADNDTVEDCLNKISKLGNEGSFIADRLVSWKPNFLLTEYRALQEAKDKGEKFAAEVLNIVNEMLTITEGAPTLEIKEPKGKKK
jgi:hypothetical protein